MTTDDATQAVRALLAEAEAAHGVYETTELSGVYDQAWPAWYAAYAVDRGIGELVGHVVTTDELATFLASTFETFKVLEPKPSEGWASWTAGRITAEL